MTVVVIGMFMVAVAFFCGTNLRREHRQRAGEGSVSKDYEIGDGEKDDQDKDKEPGIDLGVGLNLMVQNVYN